jgi:hypothetical protein
MTASGRSPAHYGIRIRGQLDPAWSTWFDGLTITQEKDGTTELAGSLADQAALFGLLPGCVTWARRCGWSSVGRSAGQRRDTAPPRARGGTRRHP